MVSTASGLNISCSVLTDLGVSGQDFFMTEVKTIWGRFCSEQEVLILDQDGEDLVSGVIWFNSVMTAKRSEITKIVDIRGFGMSEEVPIEVNQDVAPEDELLENSDLDACPS